MSSGDIWYVKLTPEHRAFFDDKAEEAKDTERGAAARQCRKALNKIIEEEAEAE